MDNEEITQALHSIGFTVDSLIYAIRKAGPLETIILNQALSKARETRSLISGIDCALNKGEPSATALRPQVG